jgi:hypothetical protein
MAARNFPNLPPIKIVIKVGSERNFKVSPRGFTVRGSSESSCATRIFCDASVTWTTVEYQEDLSTINLTFMRDARRRQRENVINICEARSSFNPVNEHLK